MTKPLAVIRTYDELILGLRQRADALNISRESIDAISGLQSGYAGKLLAPIPMRTLSRVSLGAMLGALGLKMVLMEDIETLKKIEKRLTKRRRRVDADDTMPTNKRPRKGQHLRGCSEWGRLLRARALVNQSPQERRRLARHAAQARWGKRETITKVPVNKGAETSALDTTKIPSSKYARE